MGMTRKIIILLGLLIAIISFLYVPQAQTQDKKWKKAITLPNGEVILDISGEWDVLVENYGPWKEFGSYPQLVRITQDGTSFNGVRMIDDPNNPKGSTSIRGDLNKDGFKNVYTVSHGWGPTNCNGQISEDGNKFTLDDGRKVRVIYTRK